MRFTLPDGTPPPGIPLDPVDGVRFPAHMTWDADGVSIGYLVERSAAAVVSVNAAARKARDVLRFERGLVYDVNLDYEPLDGRLAHGYIGADSRAADTGTVRDVLLGALESIDPRVDTSRPYPTWSTSTVEGQTVRAAGWPLRNRNRKDRLTVGEDGVSWDSGDGGKLTVRYADCVAYVHWQDAHWQDARRELRGRDGFAVRLVPGDWENGAELVRRIDAAVPPGVVACGEHAIGGMEDPVDQPR